MKPIPDAVPAPDTPVRSAAVSLKRDFSGAMDAKAMAARSEALGASVIEPMFVRFVEHVSRNGYEFGSLDEGFPRFPDKVCYLRYDVHVTDLLAVFTLATLHEKLRIPGLFYITWNFSPAERAVEEFFRRLLEFDGKYVQLGLHCAPVTTWMIHEEFGGRPKDLLEFTKGPDFLDYLKRLRNDMERLGSEADSLERIRVGGWKYMSRITDSFRSVFGSWSTVTGHGNVLMNAFARASRNLEELAALSPWFNAVDFLSDLDVTRYGFAYEATRFDNDNLPGKRILFDGRPIELLRERLATRLNGGGGFIFVFHPANWTCAKFKELTVPLRGAER